jgi:hypothetical protein
MKSMRQKLPYCLNTMNDEVIKTFYEEGRSIRLSHKFYFDSLYNKHFWETNFLRFKGKQISEDLLQPIFKDRFTVLLEKQQKFKIEMKEKKSRNEWEELWGRGKMIDKS